MRPRRQAAANPSGRTPRPADEPYRRPDASVPRPRYEFEDEEDEPAEEPTVEETEPVHEHYTIADDALVAPKPNEACFGRVDNPADMEPILKKAKWILDGQQTYFQTNQEIYDGSIIRYYLDDSIFAVT